MSLRELNSCAISRRIASRALQALAWRVGNCRRDAVSLHLQDKNWIILLHLGGDLAGRSSRKTSTCYLTTPLTLFLCSRPPRCRSLRPMETDRLLPCRITAKIDSRRFRPRVSGSRLIGLSEILKRTIFWTRLREFIKVIVIVSWSMYSRLSSRQRFRAVREYGR